jgi:hypothetical protein
MTSYFVICQASHELQWGVAQPQLDFGGPDCRRPPLKMLYVAKVDVARKWTGRAHGGVARIRSYEFCTENERMFQWMYPE